MILIRGRAAGSADVSGRFSEKALEQLRDLGVEVKTGVHATNLTEAGLQVGDEFIPCRVKIWAAGNTASFVGRSLGVPIDKVGRVLVNNDLTIPTIRKCRSSATSRIFRIKPANRFPAFHRWRCSRAATRRSNILAMIDHRKPQRFWYWDKGSMATIGRNKAVADLNLVHFSGLPAWLVWLFVHIVFLVGFRNRIVVLLQWAWAYFSFNKGARLITRNFQAETRPPA